MPHLLLYSLMKKEAFLIQLQIYSIALFTNMYVFTDFVSRIPRYRQHDCLERFVTGMESGLPLRDIWQHFELL